MGKQINAGVLVAAKTAESCTTKLAQAVSPYVADILSKGQCEVSMTTSWGGTSLPDPTNITLLDDFAARSSRPSTACYIPTNATPNCGFNSEWNAVTVRSSARFTKALTNTSATIIFPLYAESPGPTVLPIRSSLSSTPVGGASSKVNVSCSVRTVTWSSSPRWCCCQSW